MSYISTYPKKNSNILRLQFEENIIQFDPDYQRNGDIWPLEKRQLLIDSILNDYDIPKLYFHVLPMEARKKLGKEYAIVDGRQRIDTILRFIKGEFPLANDFDYLRDKKVKASGFYYKDIAENYPNLKMAFESFELPITCIETDDIELIEDMFLRLNEAVPLNAAEKRNGLGGPMVKSLKKVALDDFFKLKVAFNNRRFQHLEAAIRLLFLEHFLQVENKIYDTKKTFLDALVRKYASEPASKLAAIEKEVLAILKLMSSTFSAKDPLLRTQSSVPIYYLVFRDAHLKKLPKITRKQLLGFREELAKNKRYAEEDIKKANYDLIEFDRMSLQGTNDASSIKERHRILAEFLKK